MKLAVAQMTRNRSAGTSRRSRSRRSRRAHLGPGGTPVEVRLVENDQEVLVRIVFEERPGHVEYGSLDRTHHHVFEHRVVGNKEVGGRTLDFVARKQFAVIRQRNAPDECTRFAVPPSGALLAQPGTEVRFRRPLAALL